MAKMYFAEFTNTETGETFQKFGHTRNNDAMVRINKIIEEYPKFTGRILAAVYHHNVEYCQGVEETFKQLYPKNFWLEEKISGITECVILEYETRNGLIKKIMKLNEITKKGLTFNESRP
jgi:hypothetical protein